MAAENFFAHMIYDYGASAQASLPGEEWDFTSAAIVKPPTWQWNDWLDYEYARSCRPIVQAVHELRNRKPPDRECGSLPQNPKFPRHAVYLAHHYPDFLRTPWLNLPADQHNFRKDAGDQIGSPFDEGALEVVDPFYLAYRIATGDVWLDEQNLTDQKYALFKIDFLREVKLIEKKFRTWLQRRRVEYLKIRAAAEDTIDAKAAMPPKRRKGAHSGQANNQRNYTTAFRQLAALRLLEHFQYNYVRCTQETGLYNGRSNTRWFDAANQAAARLVRFNIMWTLEAEPAYFFKFGEIHEELKWHTKLEADLTCIKDKTKLKERLKTLFCGYSDRQKLCR